MRPSARRAGVLVALLAVPASGSARAATPPATGVDFRALYDAATTMYKAGSYAEALVAYDKAYALEPRPEALYGRARCHDQLKHTGEAIELYEQFLTEAPAHEGAAKVRAYLVPVLYGVGHRKLAAGDHAGARAAFERALEHHASADPDLVTVSSGALCVGVGEALAGLGDEAGAVVWLRKALAPPPSAEIRAHAEALLSRIESKPVPAPTTAPAMPAAAAAPPVAGPKPRRIWPAVVLTGVAAVVIGAAVVTLFFALRPSELDRARRGYDGWIFDFEGGS